MDHFKKSLLNLFQYCFYFILFVCFFCLFVCFCFVFVFLFVCLLLDHKTCGIVALDQGWNPNPLHWKSEVLTSGPPRKSLKLFFVTSFYSVEIFKEYWSVKSIWVIQILTHLTGRYFKELKKDCVDLLSTQLNHFQTLCFIPYSHEPLLSHKVKLLSRVRFFATPWAVAYHVSPSMGFSRQEYWNGLPFPSPEDLPDPGIEPWSPAL